MVLVSHYYSTSCLNSFCSHCRALVKHFDRMVEGKDVKKLKIYLPLCGKSLDLKWLADKNLDVTGIEFVEKGVRDFFKEQDLSFSEESTSKESLKLFKSKDGRIKLYRGDYFELDRSVLGDDKFDLIFDRGAFVAVNIGDREKYVDQMCSLIHKDTKWLLVTMDYDPEKWNGPPHFVTTQEITEKYFDPNRFTVEFLDEMDCLNQRRRDDWGLDWIVERTYLISLKL